MTTLIRDLGQDLRYAGRTLAQRPSFTVICVLTLALGIGANTAIFSLIHALFWQAPPVARPQELIGVYELSEGRIGNSEISYADYADYRERNTVFSDLAAHGFAWFYLAAGEDSQEVRGRLVSANYFSLLGVQPAAGRFLVAEEDGAPGAHPVAIVSYGLAERLFGGAMAVGKTLRANGVSLTVIGVAPEDFRGIHGGDVDELWAPLSMAPQLSAGEGFGREGHWLSLIGRLKPGETLERARSEFSLIARQLEQAYPATNQGRSVFLNRLRGVHPQAQPGSVEAPLLLMAFAGCLLLTACANLAGLLLARNAARRREIAVRLSIGAGRGRLVRQLLTESLLLAALGGIASLLLVFWAQDALALFYSYSLPGLDAKLDTEILGFAAALAVLTGLFFGIVPAFRATGVREFALLKGSAAHSTGRQSRLRNTLVAGQFAISTLLLVGAGLLLQSLWTIYLRPGIDQENIIHFRLRATRIGYDLAKSRIFHRDLLQRLEAVPGVEAATLAKAGPSLGWCCPVALSLPGAEANGAAKIEVDNNEVTPGFLEMLKIPVIRGRGLDERDRDGAPKAAIVNGALADLLWPGQDSIGKTLLVAGEPHEVVGLTPNTYVQRSGEAPAPYLYLSYWQGRQVDSRLYVRVAGNAAAVWRVLRREIVAVDPNVHVGQEMMLAERTAMGFQSEQLVGTVLAIAALLALLLSAIGLYGVLSFSVSQRTREIGVRVALGARSGNVLRLVMGHGAYLTLIGAAIGLAAAYVSSRTFAHYLYGVTAHDPVTFAAAPLVLGAVALLASCLPARRAARVDPMTALRHE